MPVALSTRVHVGASCFGRDDAPSSRTTRHDACGSAAPPAERAAPHGLRAVLRYGSRGALPTNLHVSHTHSPHIASHCGTDFCGLPQKDEHGERTDAEKAVFSRGLTAMSACYASMSGTAVLVQKTIAPRPAYYATDRPYLDVPYDQRADGHSLLSRAPPWSSLHISPQRRRLGGCRRASRVPKRAEQRWWTSVLVCG
jgi:hypothetical protein